MKSLYKTKHFLYLNQSKNSQLNYNPLQTQ